MRKNLFQKTSFFFFGVLLPAATLIIEQLTGMCADALNYDPIPTAFHVVAVALVPIVFLTLALVSRSKKPDSRLWRFCIGIVTGISVVYAIPFIPLLPFALIGVFFGIGLLLLAPLASAILGFVVLYKMWKSAEPRGWWGSAGILAAFSLLTILALPTIIADRAMDKLSSADEGERLEAIQTLRTINPDLVETRLCSHRRTQIPNPISPAMSALGGSTYTEIVPEVFWRITGKKCEVTSWGRGQQDPNRPGLSFASSRLDTSVDAKSATAYTEWLYEVKNSDTFQREADFIVQLPPGGVVSRVTLWVHGEPREATIAGRGKAEHAYKTVVSRAMDPILVTSVGPDRIRVRMFPVLTSETMRARIGISQPALLDSNGKPNVLFPYVIDGNVENLTTHYVWAEAKHEISGWKGEVQVGKAADASQVRAGLTNAELSTFFVSSNATPDPQVFTRFRDVTLRQQARVFDPKPLKEIIVVLDSGLGMDEHKDDIRKALRPLAHLPPRMQKLNYQSPKLTLIVAGDTVQIPVKQESAEDAFPKIDRLFSDIEFEGGHDNVEALTKAREMAHGSDATIVWIHAGQPYTFTSLMTVPERDRLKIYELQVDTLRDVNVDVLHAAGVLQAIPRRGVPGDDLERWLKEFREPTWRIERDWTLDPPQDDSEYVHLSRVFANEQVFELIRAGEQEEALTLAGDFRIVTPVSAAIVLETQEQYDEFGLERAGNEGVPSIPEPHEWAMIIIGCVALLVAVRKSRNNPQFNMVGA